MDISSISGYSSGFSMSAMQGMRKPPEMTQEMATNLASKMIENKDEDGDGFLSLAETGLDEEAFGNVDADGDGMLSSEELSAGVMDKNEDLRSLAPPPPFEMGSEEETDFLSAISQRSSQTGLATYQGAMEDFMDALLAGTDSLSVSS